MEKIKFSCLMSVYKKEKSEFFEEALDSIYKQTLSADEFVLVEDGILTDELYAIIEKYKNKINNFIEVKLPHNIGLGEALKIGTKHCKYEYIMRMDSDDIAKSNRFELQIEFARNNPKIDVFGTDIYEFKESIKEKMRLKKMPSGLEINKYILKRNPINHMTVCIKRESLEKSGGYLPMLYLEDYYLWVRMYNLGMKIENINVPLVYARIGNGFEKRRGNPKQLEGWKKLQSFMLNEKIIGKMRYVSNMLRMYFLVLCPNFIRKIIYKFLRSN